MPPKTARKRNQEVVSDSDEDIPLHIKFPRHVQVSVSDDVQVSDDDDEPLFQARNLLEPPASPKNASQARVESFPPPPAESQPQNESSPSPPPRPEPFIFVNDPVVTDPKVRRQLNKVIDGCREIVFKSPLSSAGLEAQVDILIEAAIHYDHVRRLELQATSTLPTLNYFVR